MAETDWTDELKEFGAIGRRPSLAEEAAATLRKFILLGKLEPGIAVPERDLAEALGISRTPLKEALRILENEGLIVYGPTRRPRVADPSLEDLAQNLAVLGALEALSGELACVNATNDEVAKVAQLEQNMRLADDDVDALEFFNWDMEFHKTIVSAARNVPLLKTHRAYNARLWRARFISSNSRTARNRTLMQHGNILAAFENRDGEACARHMRGHLRSAVYNISAAFACGEKGEAP